MVRYCAYCKKYFEKGSSRSFHGFPKDSERKKTWINILGLSQEYCLLKTLYICSDHFTPSDFSIKPSGVRYLKNNVIPSLPSTSKSGSDEMESNKENIPPEENIEFDVFEDVAQGSVSSSATLTASPNVFSVASSSATETAKESDIEIEKDVFGISPPKKRLKLSRPRYVGDCTTDDMSSPRRAKTNWKLAKNKVIQQRKQIKNLQQSRRRLKARIVCLKSLLRYLKQTYYISESAEATIEASLPGVAADVMKRVLKGPSHQRYEPRLRAFALTLNFYSPKAYNYVREKFNNSLPHPTTISKWYNSVNGSPGFTEEALRAIKIKVALAKQKGRKVLCNLVIDEVCLMKKVEWTGKKCIGYVDLGINLNSDNLPEATEALVFMLVCLNDNWKVTVGYFLLHGLSGLERANLVVKCLEFLNESDIMVTSLTFDGAASNLTMAKALGASFENPLALRTYFKNPVNDNNIHLYLDPCHMIKLVRNCLGSQKVLKIGEEKIEWKYLEKLVELQNIEGLHAATKLKRRHLQWVREKMKVKIAAQTFSKSVADAIMFLKDDLKLEDFQNAEASANFFLLCNNLFDIFNSRNMHAKYFYKKALSPETEEQIFEYLNYCKSYIHSLTLNDEPILNTGRKTGFLGFLICIQSLQEMYTDLVKKETPLLKYMLTYKLSQDHLEIFFSAIRSRSGSNNNPTPRQFEASYKRLLIHTEVKGSDEANVVALDPTSILYTSSNITKIESGEDLTECHEYLNICKELNEHDYLSSNAWHLTVFSDDIVKYIGGFVVKCLQKCVTCVKCLDILESKDSSQQSLLQKRKTYGRLTNASRFVTEICKIAETSVRILKHKQNIFSRDFNNVKSYLAISALRNLPTGITDYFNDHIYDSNPLNDHATDLIKLILHKYLDIRLHHETALLQDSVGNRVRHILTKTVLFKNQ